MKNKTGYGYIIVIACFLLMLIVFGTQLSFGVFFKPLSAEFGWTRAATSGPFTLCGILGAAVSFVSGRLSDKFGPRKVITVSGIFLGLGYILTSLIQNLWQFYLAYGIFLAVGVGSVWVPLASTVTRWFVRRRNLMTGIAISGIGFGLGVVPLGISHLLEWFTWRTSLFIVGAASLVLVIALAQLLKKEPDELARDLPVNNKTLPANSDPGFSFNEAVKTRQFWMIILAWVAYGVFYQVGTIHSVPYATDLGMTAVAAAGILTVMGLIGVPGRVAMGFSADKISIKTTVVLSYFLLAAAFLGLVLSQTIGTLYVFAAIFGLFSGIGILLTPFVAELFGLKALGSITGAITCANSIGGAIGPTLAGGIFDTTGSYFYAFLLCVVLGIFCTMVVWSLKPIKRN